MPTNSPVLSESDTRLPNATQPRDALLRFETESFPETFNIEPLALSHNLSGLDLFKPEALLALAEKYSTHPQDAFVASSAPAPNVDFNSVPHGQHSAHVAMTLLDEAPYRILLKRPENQDAGFSRANRHDFAGHFGCSRWVRERKNRTT